MKKTIFSMIALAMAAITFTSCEDVPAPYDYPGTGGDNGSETPGEAVGDGTEANPFNCVAALNFTSALDADVESENDVYIKGKIVSIEEEYTTQYGNAAFTISEDGTANNTFKVWRAMYLGNKKFTNSDTQIQIGDEVIVCGKVVNFKGNTPETVQNKAYLYSLNGKKADGSTVSGEPTGDGTEANPFNSVAANQIASKLASGENSAEYYIKGKVVSVTEQYGTQFGNATFYISDDGTSANQFYVFRALYFNNKKYTSGTLLKPGDEVVICGKITNFMGNTPETVQGEAYLCSLNGNKGNGDDKPTEGTPTGDGSEANPFNSVAANQAASALGSGETSSQGYYIKGKVVSVKEQYGTQFGNATFYISDDGKSANQFCVYRALYLNNEKYTSGTLLQPGDDVVIYGKLTNYMGNTPETAQGEAYLVSLKSNGGSGEEPGGGEVSGNTISVTAASFGLDNGEAVTTLKLSDGTTLTFDGGGNSNSPKYYNTGTNIRMYPKNSVKVSSSKTITKIVFNVDEYNGAIYNASGDISAAPGSVSVDGTNVNISNINTKETTITNTSTTTGAASQIRIVSITITYAE